MDTTGISLVSVFSRRTTHLLCPSGEGAKADKARELGTPIVDMTWLASIANTGEIPNTAPPLQDEDPVLDLQLQSQRPRDAAQDEWMASQPPATISPKADVKGKGKATDTMIDITNAHADNAQPPSQSLSYYDSTSSNEPRPGQADQMDQMEAFGMPNFLLDGSQPVLSPRAPDTPRHPSRTPPNRDEDLPATQPMPEEGESVSIPSRMHEDRIPSSESPSPMRMPGMPTPQDSAPAPRTPAKPVRQATVILQTRLTTLLGKRPNEDDDEAETGGERVEENLSAKKLKAQNSRLGKRLKPLQRTMVCRVFMQPLSSVTNLVYGSPTCPAQTSSAPPARAPRPR